MSKGGKITRIILGESSWTSRGDMNIIATKGDVAFSAAKKVNFHGVEEGVHIGDYDFKEEEKDPQKGFSGWWSPDYDGIRNIPEQDSNGPKAYLEQTVYFQLNVSDRIPLGTSITFQLWDKDTPFIPLFNDVKFDDKRVYRTAMVREVNGERRITIELFLNPKWHNDIKKDRKLSVNACLEFYWTWKYNNQYWDSISNILDVYASRTTLFIKPAINDIRYGLPEIYTNNGSIILYAIDKLPDGIIKKFSTIKLRTITTFKFQADINKFKREIYNEIINLDTNRLESANYEVEEMTSFFNTRKNASQIYIDENIIEVPIEARGKLAVKNFGTKIIKFAKEAAKIYGQIEILKEMKEMIPELSSNEKFNMPSLSTFVGFVPQLAVFAFGVEVIGWMVKGSLKEADDVVDESFWADWQNAKARGLKEALKFVESPWAVEKGFGFTQVSQDLLYKILKGELKKTEEIKTYQQAEITNGNNHESSIFYFIFYFNVFDEERKINLTLIDSVFTDS